MHRRVFLVLPAALVACHRSEPRCAFCGMRLDPSSPWLSETTGPDGATHSFDSPKCALLAWRTGKVPVASLRVHDFYDARWVNANAVVFALGSDVTGPMGADAVPVDPARAAKFTTDHHAERMLKVAELTKDVLESL